MITTDDVLTIHQVAKRLKRSVRWIEYTLSDGTFPIPRLQSLGRGRVRRARLWSKHDVDRFIENDATLSRRRR